jgi:hypothetical protein
LVPVTRIWITFLAALWALSGETGPIPTPD